MICLCPLGPQLARAAGMLVANPLTPPDHLFQLADALDELRGLLPGTSPCAARLGRCSVSLRLLAVQRHLTSRAA